MTAATGWLNSRLGCNSRVVAAAARRLPRIQGTCREVKQISIWTILSAASEMRGWSGKCESHMLPQADVAVLPTCLLAEQGIKNVPNRLRIVVQRKRNEDDEDSVRGLPAVSCCCQPARPGPAIAATSLVLPLPACKLLVLFPAHRRLPRFIAFTSAGGALLLRDTGRRPEHQGQGRGGARGLIALAQPQPLAAPHAAFT